MRRLGTILTLGFLAGALLPGCTAGTGYETIELELNVCASGPTLEGIDVSKWQGTINWDQVAGAGIQFAFIRVSDGVNTMDEKFQYNWAEAKRVGILRGVYQFFRPNQDPVAQANIVINEIGGAMEPGDLPPVIDVEADGGLSKSAVATRIQQWIDRIESVLGVTPIIYTSPGLWSSYVDSSAYSDYPLWVAHFYVTCPRMPTGWTDWLFHQYSDSGTVSGINTNSVDRNLFNGTLADLQALTWGDPVCGDGVCQGSEDHTTCPGDCPTCEPVPAAGRIIDQTDVCLEKGGEPQYWRTESAGYDGSLIWTHAVSSQVYNYAVWHLEFEQPGLYRVEAYTAAPWAESKQAKYQVRHDGVTAVEEVDQTAYDGWVVVGEFEFAAGGSQWVRLEDLTGESSSSNTRVVVDALRVFPVQPQADPPPDPSGCETVPPQGRVIDETDECLELGGDARWWRTEQAGWDGALKWTHAVSTQVYNYAVWSLAFDQGGWYRLEAYTASPWAESEHAKYQVRHNGTTETVEVDQTATNGWTVVGEFQFGAGDDQWVRLEDLTGESLSTGTRVVFDAIRLTPAQAPVTCAPIPETGRVIDETELCFEAGGAPQWWRNEAAGYDNTLMWTNATATRFYNYGIWHLDFTQAGKYRLEAFTASPWAETRQAKYQVHHNTTTTTVSVDQTTDGWTLVGEFQFADGADQWVRLEDLTGEPNASGTAVVFDALRVTLVQSGYGGAEEDDPQNRNVPGADEVPMDKHGLYTGYAGCNTGRGGHIVPFWLLLTLGLLIFRRRRGQG